MHCRLRLAAVLALALAIPALTAIMETAKGPVEVVENPGRIYGGGT